MQNEGRGTNHQDRSGLRLPELKLKSFSGDCRKYRLFKVTFQNVCKRNRLTKWECFDLLRSKLEGDAAEEVDRLDVHESNYEKAWEILDRPGNASRQYLAK